MASFSNQTPASNLPTLANGPLPANKLKPSAVPCREVAPADMHRAFTSSLLTEGGPKAIGIFTHHKEGVFHTHRVWDCGRQTALEGFPFLAVPCWEHCSELGQGISSLPKQESLLGDVSCIISKATPKTLPSLGQSCWSRDLEPR